MENSTRKVFLITFFSRILVILASFLFLKIFKDPGSFTSFLTTFANHWDGHHYLFIAQNGYVSLGVERYFIVFPPFYPFLIRAFDVFFRNPALTAVIISNIFFVLGCLLLFNLLRLDYSENFSLMVVFLLAVFPSSYFFSTAYAESLYLFLFCVTFLLARQGRFLGASCLASLAVLTKPFGIIIWPAILIEWFKSAKRSWSALTVILAFMIFSAGIYLYFNYMLFGDIFAFQKFLETNWYKSFSWPWISVIESWKRGSLTPEWSIYKIYVGMAEAITATAAWVVAFVGLSKWAKLRLSYALYMFLGVLFFTSTTFILSSPRYLLSLPPFFIILTQLLNRRIAKFIWVIFSVVLMFYFSFTFARGQWAF
jgi:Gpi18-like mannosyltransferase